MSRMSKACSDIQEILGNINGLSGLAENVICSLQPIIESVADHRPVGREHLMQLEYVVSNYNNVRSSKTNR